MTHPVLRRAAGLDRTLLAPAAASNLGEGLVIGWAVGRHMPRPSATPQ